MTAAASTREPSVVVVVPAHRASEELDRCLEALACCDPAPDELVVVVDGADPATVAAAEARAGRVVGLERAGGPARARNAGVADSDAEVVFFVDSDVVVPPDVVGRLRDTFGSRPELDAVIGSYDDEPPAPGVTSQYKNLLNHHVHQTADVRGSTFWGACGAVRRAAFEAVGGFDERYSRPCIEDIELGARLTEAGHRIEVLKELQVTHLKRWTPASMVRADVFDRAVPWSELIVGGLGFTDDLNVSRRQRFKAVTACVGVVALLGARWRLGRGATLASLFALTLMDRSLLGFFARKRGPAFAVGAAGWHWASYLYSSAAFGAVWLRRFLGGRRLERGATVPTSSAAAPSGSPA